MYGQEGWSPERDEARNEAEGLARQNAELWRSLEARDARIRELEKALTSIEKEISGALRYCWLSNLIRARDTARAALRGEGGEE